MTRKSIPTNPANAARIRSGSISPELPALAGRDIELKAPSVFRENEWTNGRTGEVGQAFLVIKGKKFRKGMDFMVMFAERWRDLATWRDPDGRRLSPLPRSF
jgi:hypothetical protein